MQGVSTESRASLINLALRTDKEITQSSGDSGIETKRSRQAFFLKFCSSHKIDPKSWLGSGELQVVLVSMYAVDIISGNNINKLPLRAQTVREYLEAVNELFDERGYERPTNFEQKRSAPTLFYENLKTWESEPNRRTHITQVFLDEFIKLAEEDVASPYSIVHAMLDWTKLGRYTGSRLAEYGQATEKRIEYHELPNGGKIMKALCRNDFCFKDKSGKAVLNPVANRQHVYSVTITWRVQKNRRNGQKITWVLDSKNPVLCPVKAAIRIYNRSIILGMTADMPMGVYKNERGDIRFLTGNKISKLFKKIAARAYEDITDAELKQYSAHMIRVSACVILQVADKPADFIKSRLRWESDAYRVYLRDTSTPPIRLTRHTILGRRIWQSPTAPP